MFLVEHIKKYVVRINFLDNLEFYISSKDYTVSNEDYKLLYNKEYDLLITDPIPDDLSKYYESDEYISHTDGNKSLIDKIYKIVKNYTLKKKLKLINSFKTESKTILDIGAGTGDFLSICKENNWEVNGVEPSDNAKKLASNKGITLDNNINIYDKKFDIITMWHVLEHVPNLQEYIIKIKKLLKVNGIIIIAVPNYKSYDAIYYKEYWAAFDVPRHLWHFSKTSIEKLFSTVNMKIINVLPMKFDSYYVSLLSEKYKTGNIKPIKSFLIGLKSNMKGKKTKEYSSHIYIIKNN